MSKLRGLIIDYETGDTAVSIFARVQQKFLSDYFPSSSWWKFTRCRTIEQKQNKRLATAVRVCVHACVCMRVRACMCVHALWFVLQKKKEKEKTQQNACTTLAERTESVPSFWPMTIFTWLNFMIYMSQDEKNRY